MTDASAHASALDATVVVRNGTGLRSRLDRVRQLCESAQAKDVDGGRTDVEALWPSQILAILDGDS